LVESVSTASTLVRVACLQEKYKRAIPRTYRRAKKIAKKKKKLE